MHLHPKSLFATATAILILASGCVGNGATTPAAVPVSSGSDAASGPARSATAAIDPGSIVQVGTGRAMIKGRVTYGANRSAALLNVGMLDSQNKETWVRTDINGWYAFTGLDLGKEYMVTVSPDNGGGMPAPPVVRHVTLTQVETTVDAQLPLSN